MRTIRSNRNKHILAASVAVLLAITSFGATYWNLQRSGATNNLECESANYTTSADGLVVANEADLSCAGIFEHNQSTKELINLAGISLGALATGAALFLLYQAMKSTSGKKH